MQRGGLKSYGDILLVEWETLAVIRVSDDVEEFRELVQVFISASCCEHGMGKMIYVFPHPAVGVKESPNPPSRAYYRVRMSPTPINESDRVYDSAVSVTLGFQNPVSRPADTDDRSAGFDPGASNSHQGVSGSVRNGHEEVLSGLPFGHCPTPTVFSQHAPFGTCNDQLAFIGFESCLDRRSFPSSQARNPSWPLGKIGLNQRSFLS